MKQENYITRVLTPDDGHLLTQVGDVDPANRIVTNKVYLAVNDDPANWREITVAEADAYHAQTKAAIDAVRKQMADDRLTATSDE